MTRGSTCTSTGSRRALGTLERSRLRASRRDQAATSPLRPLPLRAVDPLPSHDLRRRDGPRVERRRYGSRCRLRGSGRGPNPWPISSLPLRGSVLARRVHPGSGRGCRRSSPRNRGSRTGGCRSVRAAAGSTAHLGTRRTGHGRHVELELTRIVGPGAHWARHARDQAPTEEQGAGVARRAVPRRPSERGSRTRDLRPSAGPT
jgi:hypothetical protein